MYIAQKQADGVKTLDRFLKTGSRGVIYGIGRDAGTLLSLFPEKVPEKIIFCDKKAAEKTIWYQGKKVIALESIESDDFVFIATRKYKEEVYESLVKRGILKNRIGIIWGHI